jgi:hypothetical protein
VASNVLALFSFFCWKSETLPSKSDISLVSASISLSIASSSLSVVAFFILEARSDIFSFADLALSFISCSLALFSFLSCSALALASSAKISFSNCLSSFVFYFIVFFFCIKINIFQL